MTSLWLAYPLFGCIAGLLAGLLGVGGGLVMVPALLYLLPYEGISAGLALEMALGTSMAVICFTSISSFRAHNERGSVDWRAFWAIAPGVLAGSFGGTFVATRLPTTALKIGFAAFVTIVCVRMWSAPAQRPRMSEPKRALLTTAGLVIGVVSALVGIGGGSLTVPFLVACGTAMRVAVGTSAAVGLPIAVAGAAGYVVNGLGAPDLPPHSLGFVHLPALVGIAATSVPLAPVGARLAHRLPVVRLQRIFAGFLLLVALKIIWDAAQ